MQATLTESDRFKAILEIDKMEYQALRQEIMWRLDAHSKLFGIHLTALGFVTLMAAPAAAVVLKPEGSQLLLYLTTTCGMLISLAFLSAVIFYEMMQHYRYMARAAAYLNRVIRPRLQTLILPSPTKINASDSRAFGVLDWESFLLDIGLDRRAWHYRGALQRVARPLYELAAHHDLALRGEIVPGLIAILASAAAAYLLGSNWDLVWGGKFETVYGTKPASMQDFDYVLLLVARAECVLVGLLLLSCLMSWAVVREALGEFRMIFQKDNARKKVDNAMQ